MCVTFETAGRANKENFSTSAATVVKPWKWLLYCTKPEIVNFGLTCAELVMVEIVHLIAMLSLKADAIPTLPVL